ncbi:FAD-binding protein [Herbiconiux moechotypicola]|uniref:FAD-binding protein n=1 Tax=Herbiconiux moechotypicola TaxID=637393 RepID=A0ABP5Q3L3_9MICO|nr:FAD-binding protein [Herbiconiux moechotypicola]MCS5729120.1 FAD-binding protein [Herbiconiux moechotypicola]
MQPGSNSPGSNWPGSNWAGTHRFAAGALVEPRSVAEAQEVVAASRRVRALGSRHSFNDLADPGDGGVLLSLEALDAEADRELRIDPLARTVSVPSATRYATLATHLEAAGWALENMGSLPHISVGGAVATGTHGSGDRNRNLSAAVVGVELIDGTGSLVRIDDGDERFGGAVIALGALGVTTRLTLRIRPSYRMRQDVYLDLPWETALGRFDEVMGGAYSVSLFTDWRDSGVHQVWVKSRVDDGPVDADAGWFGARSAGAKVMSPADEGHDNTTVQGGVEGPWCERLPHFRIDATPSNGDEIQTEYFVDRSVAPAALEAVRSLASRIRPHLLVSEVRTVAGDGQWLSPTRGAASVGIHFTWQNHPEAVRELLPVVEAALEPFEPRPHWGKWFALDGGAVAARYPTLGRFAELAEQLDPGRRFRNPYLERVLGLPR